MQKISQFTIGDEGSALFIRAEAPRKLWEHLVLAGFAGILSSILGNDFFPSHSWPLFGVLFAVAINFAVPAKRRAELRMSGVECYSQANFGKSLARQRVVLMADILWLEYDEQGFSLRDQPSTAGLYAARKSGSICLLPLLDGEQTIQVIAAIERKFPGLAETWRKRSPRGKSIQALPAA